MNNELALSSKNCKVLVCDDDLTYLILMRETLEAGGFEVIDAADGETALNKYLSHRPDIVLLDVQMPLLSGFNVCQKIRASSGGEDVPILMVTGSDDVKSIEKAYEVGATDFLPKPIKWPMIAHRVRYMLRSRAAVYDLQKSEERLRYLAYYDTLTGLANRQSFRENLDKLISLAKRGCYNAAVLFIDLDRFKRINDTLGHDFGDRVLQQIALKLEETLRHSDLLARNYEADPALDIARLGGDEFTILLSRVESLNDVAIVAQRIIDSLSEPIKIDQYEVVITPSIGVSVYPDDGLTVDDLLKYADIAMYDAKDKGRRCFQFYSDKLNIRALDRLKLEQSLRAALVKNQFELHFQPQVDLKSGDIISAEALIRWHHPELGMVPPGEFIPLAEESGLIIEIGRWVLITACQTAKAWLDNEISCRVSVNVSSLQFKQTAFVEEVRGALLKTQLPPEFLELEVTESILMNDVNENIERLTALKAMGVTLAIDDFGTGYSSLNYLKKFPIDMLKIDRSFVNDLANNEDDGAIVNAIMALASTMKLGVVAEGVETHEQLDILKKYQDLLIQGYLLSRPIPAAAMDFLLKSGLAAEKLRYLTSTSVKAFGAQMEA